jgi:uncharacterized protein (TIGR02466 family)
MIRRRADSTAIGRWVIPPHPEAIVWQCTGVPPMLVAPRGRYSDEVRSRPEPAHRGWSLPTRALFPTLVYSAALQTRGARALNLRLFNEIRQLRRDDVAGRKWSAKSYPGGFTSYASANRLHQVSPTFALLERRLARHVRTFCRALEFDVDRHQLTMTDCWANIMPAGVTHGLHLHPLSTISGTYYVRVPRDAPGLKFEDPRLDRMMASPPRRSDSEPGSRPWFVVPAVAGRVILFESWLRHEVTRNSARAQRVSISFNFNWF